MSLRHFIQIKSHGKISDDTFDELNSSFLSDKTKKQEKLNNIENELNSIKEKELNSNFINEQKEKIIKSFKDFKELNYGIVNSFIDFIEIGEKNKETKSQDVVIHWNFQIYNKKYSNLP